jgi:S1-C subfamily serine protease
MRALIYLLFIIGITLSLSEAAQAQKFWNEKKSGTRDLVRLPNISPVIRDVERAVVHITTSADPKQQRPQPGPQMGPQDFFEKFFGQPFGGRQRPQRAMGSGFIISGSGYII